MRSFNCPVCGKVSAGLTSTCVQCGHALSEPAGAIRLADVIEDRGVQNATKRYPGAETNYIVERLMHGLDRPTIVAGLSEMGLSEEEASNSYDDVYTKFHAIVEDRRLSAASILRGIIGAGTAATVGGLVWGLIVAASDYEVGFLTWGLGFLAGYASKVASGKRGIPIQVIAVTGTVVALAVGKYFVYSSALWRAIEEEFGTQAASAVTPFSINVLDSFLANFSNNFTVIDALWFPPAVVVAWIIPRAVRFRITISSSGGDFSL